MTRSLIIVSLIIAIAFIAAGGLSLVGCASLGHRYQPPGSEIWKAL